MSAFEADWRDIHLTELEEDVLEHLWRGQKLGVDRKKHLVRVRVVYLIARRRGLIR